ncbi:unnamed protein product [Clonostachys solani]|uniref:Uncharacterized protein n=1 Tax=Clonostachys solani TaxID=160281 RepID=A0A9N9Z3J1_9HYPO|nr:unnamed protein product [Clonostachys solani]
MSEPDLSKRSNDANDQESTKRVKVSIEPAGKWQQLRIDSKAPSSSRKRSKNGQNGVPGRSIGSKTQVKDDNFSICERLDFRLKAYIDQDGKERLFMGVVSCGRHLPNLVSPVQGFNPGITMGVCSLGNTSPIDAAIAIAGDHSEYKHLPHMPHVFFMVGPMAKHPDSEEGTLSSRYDRIFLSSSQQRINLPPKMSRDGEDSDSDMSSHSDMEGLIRERDQTIQERNQAIQERDQAIQERNQAIQERDQVIQERDQAIQERDQAIQERKMFNHVVQTGNPYIGHNPVELVGRYSSSEGHALLYKGFMKKWEDDSLECKDKLEKATDLRARHTIIKASLDGIYRISQDFDAQATWMSARHTIPPPFDGDNSIG